MLQKKSFTEWLNEEIYIYPLIYKLYHRDLNTYYISNDQNLQSNDNQKIEELKSLNNQLDKIDDYEEFINNKSYEELYYDDQLIEDSNYTHIFRNNNKQFIQFINPYTNRYHVNMLFNMIIDYCFKNKMKDIKNNLLINKKMRNDFVKFCFSNKII